MKTHLIYNTKDYSLFEYNPYQRPISERHVKDLAASMQRHGFLHSKPIQVFKSGRKYVIVDGHNRFEAAKHLGIEVPYVVESEKAQDAMGDENATVRKWDNAAFANMFAAKGVRDYITLQQYVKAGIALNQAASMLYGRSAVSSHMLGMCIRRGEFKVKTTRHIDAVLSVSAHTGLNVFKKQTWVDAISKSLFVPEFDINVFIDRVRKNPALAIPVATSEQALRQLDEIYNYRSRTRLNIAFLAKETARNRKENPRAAQFVHQESK